MTTIHTINTQTGTRVIATKTDAELVICATAMSWMCSIEELAAVGAIKSLVTTFDIDMRCMAQIPTIDPLDFPYRYSFVDTPVGFKRCICCDIVISETDFDSNNGLCDARLDNGYHPLA